MPMPWERMPRPPEIQQVDSMPAPQKPPKNAHMAAIGRLGGIKGRQRYYAFAATKQSRNRAAGQRARRARERAARGESQ